MEDAFGTVMYVVIGVAVVVAILSFATREQVYDQIGRGGINDEREGGTADRWPAAAADSSRERDDEIRQLLEAKSARRVARGLEPLDIEAELTELTAPKVDRELLLEIREMVEARNARRIRRGQEPLDVEAEIERQVRELGDGG